LGRIYFNGLRGKFYSKSLKIYYLDRKIAKWAIDSAMGFWSTFTINHFRYSDTISYSQHHDFGKLVSKRKEHQYRKTNFAGIRDNRNPILMAGPYIKQDLRYQRELTPGVYRDEKTIYDKEDRVNFLLKILTWN
jgi:hypothetical protein